MPSRPVGTVTFLFTDMEGSTRAWEQHPKQTAAVLRRHDELVAETVHAHHGAIILERGEGDSVFAVFERASDAVAAACELQRVLHKGSWPAEVRLRVRMAVHTGEAGADYRGPHVNRAARIRAIAHGEQILVSGVTAGIVRGTLPDGASLSILDSIGCATFPRWKMCSSWRIRKARRATTKSKSSARMPGPSAREVLLSAIETALLIRYGLGRTG